MKRTKKNTRIKNDRKISWVTFLLFIIFVFCFYIGTLIPCKDNVINNSEVKTKIIPNRDLIVKEKINGREEEIKQDSLQLDTFTKNIYKSDGEKVAYLTFDDGPSANITPKVLAVLKKYEVKATFFVIGQMAIQNSSILKMEAFDGHAIGNHTYSHSYNIIYTNPQAFVDDVNKCDAAIKSILGDGYKSKLIRFPGGSFDFKRASFRDKIVEAGYYYVDWNDIIGDAEGNNIPACKLLEKLKDYTKGKEHIVILMHDTYTKVTTVEALPHIIQYLKDHGYSFRKLKEY